MHHTSKMECSAGTRDVRRSSAIDPSTKSEKNPFHETLLKHVATFSFSPVQVYSNLSVAVKIGVNFGRAT